MATKPELQELADTLTDRIAALLVSRIDRPVRLVKTREVLERACISGSHLNRLLKENKFPLPKLCSPAGRAWLESEIDNYLANLESDDWDQYLARQEKKAAAGKAGMEKKAIAAAA